MNVFSGVLLSDTGTQTQLGGKKTMPSRHRYKSFGLPITLKYPSLPGTGSYGQGAGSRVKSKLLVARVVVLVVPM